MSSLPLPNTYHQTISIVGFEVGKSCMNINGVIFFLGVSSVSLAGKLLVSK